MCTLYYAHVRRKRPLIIYENKLLTYYVTNARARARVNKFIIDLIGIHAPINYICEMSIE